MSIRYTHCFVPVFSIDSNDFDTVFALRMGNKTEEEKNETTLPRDLQT